MKYSYKRLKLAQLLGQLGVFLTFRRRAAMLLGLPSDPLVALDCTRATPTSLPLPPGEAISHLCTGHRPVQYFHGVLMYEMNRGA